MIGHVEALGMLTREQQPFGDVLSVDPRGGVLLTWYRNNALHALALPGLVACLLLNRRRALPRRNLCRMVETVYPFLAAELFVRVDPDTASVVDAWLERLVRVELLRCDESGDIFAPGAETNAAYRLELLAAVVMPILERFFIVVARLVKAGREGIDRKVLESQCQDIARRISRLQGLNAPEFFDARLFHGFVDTLIARGAATVDAEGRLLSSSLVHEVVRAAGTVLPIGFRHSVLRAGGDTELAPREAEPR
jgi:glycerol-3-phosphate O-acyltransferase